MFLFTIIINTYYYSLKTYATSLILLITGDSTLLYCFLRAPYFPLILCPYQRSSTHVHGCYNIPVTGLKKSCKDVEVYVFVV